MAAFACTYTYLQRLIDTLVGFFVSSQLSYIVSRVLPVDMQCAALQHAMCSPAAGLNGTHTRQDQRRMANAQQQRYQASTGMWQDARAEAAAAPAGPSSSASGALGEDKCSAASHRLVFSSIL